jgi:tetratricopeptide (TPR) repeat protein
MLRKHPILFLVILVMVTYANSIGNGYNFDDQLVTNNHYLTSANSKYNIIELLTKPYYSDNMGYNYGYRPITLLSFYIENHIFKESPIISHLINVLIFCLSVITFYKLILATGFKNADRFALLASGIFALHPIHTEVVNSIKNRDELLALLFALLSFKCLLGFNGKNYRLIIYSCILFSLGLLSKKSIIPLAYVMPVTLVLTRNINYQSFIYVATSLIITTFFLGGVLNSNNILIYSIISVLYIGVVFVYYQFNTIITKLKSIKIIPKTKNVFVISIQFIVYLYVLWTKQFEFLLLNVPLYYYLFKVFRTNALYLFILQGLIIDLVLGFRDFGLISLFMAIGLFVTTYSSKKIDPIKIIITLLAVLTTTYNNSEPISNFTVILITTLFFYSVERKLIIATLLTMGPIVGSLYLNNIPILGLLMLVIIILKYAKRHNILNSFLPITVSFVVLAIVVFPSIHLKPSIENPNQNNIKIETKTTTQSNVSTKEGRDLSFVENPLINQTSKEELVFTGLDVIGKYLTLNFFPYQLSFYYGYSNINKSNSKTPSSWLSLFSYLIIIGIAIWQAKKQPLIAIGFMWFTVSILFFSNWVELVAGVVGERLSYNASAGFSIFICGLFFWLMPDFLNKKNIRLEIVVVFILTLFFLKTVQRNAAWLNPVKLMSSDIEHLHNSAQANNMYATALMVEFQKSENLYEKEQLINKAVFHFKKAISIYPAFFNAHIDLAKVYIIQGRLMEAKRHFTIAYNENPNSLLVLEELIKINFDLKNVPALVLYTNQYLKYDQSNEKIYEFITHLLFENNQLNLALKYAQLGLKFYPNNQILIYINNKASFNLK